LRRKTALLAVVVAAIVLSSSFLVIWSFLPHEDGSSAEFFVGVQLGYGGVDDCKALVDKVKDYTNLFVVSSYAVTERDTELNEVCDYIYDAGLSFIIYFQYTSVNHHYSIQNWTTQAKETYGDRYLGEYFLDEIGGKQLDMGYPHIGSSYSYTGAAKEFVELVETYSVNFADSGGEDFTSDYALYWFDYKAGFDTVLAAFGWNQSRQMQISQCRGAAEVQNRDWGAMLTWTYNHPPYLESGDELYDDLILAYHSGAKYAVVFNHAKDEPYSGYGILAEEHFEALENFWNYKNGNPKKQGCLTADVAFVLPPDYGFGFRDQNDRVWRFWKEHFSSRMWNEVNELLDEYGSRLDIVYSDPEFNDKIEETYDTVLRWEFEAAESFPVRNLNTNLGYPTIQAAITSGYTLDGHVIYVTAGTYYENVVANKSVALTGEDRKTTIIDGGNVASAVKIERSASITGFTIRNGDAPAQEDEQFIDFGIGIILSDAPPDVGAGILVDWPNCRIVGNDIIDSSYGVCIRSSGNVTLRDNSIAGNGVNLMIDGDSLSHFINDIDTSNTVNGKTVHYLVNEKDRVIDSSFSDVGFLALVNCTKMTVQNLSLDNNGQGILLANTTDSTVTGNSITNNQEGIRLFASSNNVFRNNNINNNAFKLWIQDGSANDIDTSNTVDGKPIIYWVNQQSRTVPSDAGYVALINCTDITAQNLNISNNRQGILLVSTTESSIMESNLSNNCYGIQLEECADISILGNRIENNEERGVYLSQSSNNIINNNAITKSGVGIQIGSITGYFDETSSNNQIVGNSITENVCGIRFAEIESIDMFYHNSVINNTKQVDFRYQGTSNTSALLNLDNGVEGNYWSDYAGNDTNHDGIGDTEYPVASLMTSMMILENGTVTSIPPIYINITDRYPLSGMFSSFTQSGQTFNVISNSTIQNFQYNQAENTITLQAKTEGFGFCRIAIPHTALNTNSISVVINNGQASVLDPNCQLYDDGKTGWIYFAYPEGTQQIQITAGLP
jgi:parallel beta-helix repeat protein